MLAQKAISLVATIFEPGKRGKPSPYKEALEEGAHLYNDVLERRSRQHLQRRLDGRSPHKRGFSL